MQLLRYVPKEEREELGKRLREQRDLFEYFAVRLEKDLIANQKDMLKKTNYEDASWPLKQADYVGRINALQSLISLLRFE